MIPAEIWQASAGVDGAARVVLVHGSLDRSAGLLKLSRRLDAHYRVTRYDRRGYGRSVGCPGPYDMEQHVADLVEVIGGDGGRPCVVVGHSYGGNVALAAVDRHPALIAGVVTYESPLSWQPWWPGTSAGGNAMAWRDDPEEAAERFMRRLIGDDRWERLPPSSRAARRAEGTAMIGELTDLRARAPWAPDRITVPVLALHGEHGADHHRRAMHVLASSLPEATVHTIASARHFGPNTHPEEVAALVVPFVRRVTVG